MEAWLRRAFLRLVPSLVAATLSLPVLTPISALAAERGLERATAAAPAPPATAFEALGAVLAERGPGRHDEARRLDATIAPARLMLGEPLRPPIVRARALHRYDGATRSRLARWCVAHGTATSVP